MIEDAKAAQLEKEVREVLRQMAAEKDVGEVLVIIYGKLLNKNMAHRVMSTTATSEQAARMVVSCMLSLLGDAVRTFDPVSHTWQ